jgi:hypothetical protein
MNNARDARWLRRGMATSWFHTGNLVGFCAYLSQLATGYYKAEEFHMSIGTIILIILVIALLGGFSGIGGGPFYGTGYYGGGGLGLVIVVLLILLLLGKL